MTYLGTMRSGKISLQLLGSVILIISVSFLLSAWKSLGRSFDGFIVQKTIDSRFSNDYWVLLVSPPSGETRPEDVAEFLRGMGAAPAGRRVGVSGILFEEARPGQRLSKDSFSPFLFLEETRFLDMGIQWFLVGMAGFLVAGAIALQMKQLSGTARS